MEEPFASGTSILHRADPRVKILIAAGISIVVAVSQSLSAPLAGLALGLGLALLARLPLRLLARTLLRVNLFVIFLWIFLPFSAPGQTLFDLGPLAATREGVQLATLITLKANAIMLCFTALVATSSAAFTGQALRALHVPQKLVLLLVFTYRFIFVIRDEYERLARSLKARAFEPRTDLHTLRTYANLAGVLLVRSLDRSERVHRAMLCRGFADEFHGLSVLRLRFVDILLAGAGTLAAAAIILLEAS